MSTDPALRMPDGARRETIMAIGAIADLAVDAAAALSDGDLSGAMLSLDVIAAGILPLRNAIGQWIDRLKCPNCGLEGRNLVSVRQADSPGTKDWPMEHHVADIGFRCEHCQHQWGFEVLKSG